MSNIITSSQDNNFFTNRAKLEEHTIQLLPILIPDEFEKKEFTKTIDNIQYQCIHIETNAVNFPEIYEINCIKLNEEWFIYCFYYHNMLNTILYEGKNIKMDTLYPYDNKGYKIKCAIKKLIDDHKN